MFRLGIVWTAAVVAAFVIGLTWGLTGVAAAYACCNVLIAVPSFLLSGRLIGVSLSDVVGAFAGPVAASVIMGAAIWVVESLLNSAVGAPLQLTASVLTGIATYLIALYVVSPTAYQELRNLRR